jgi:hypothetical protein
VSLARRMGKEKVDYAYAVIAGGGIVRAGFEV